MYFLKPGVRRYSDLRESLPAATEKVLIQQLRQLEGDGIVERIVYPEIPPRVEYRISSHGETLMALLEQMANWAEIHRAWLDLQGAPERGELDIMAAAGV